jgi:serine protease DegQ
MKKYWSLLCQSITIFVAFFLVISIFKPDWVNPRLNLQSLNRQTASTSPFSGRNSAINSYAQAVKNAQPSVVSIVTQQKIKPSNSAIHPFLRQFFGDLNVPDSLEEGNDGFQHEWDLAPQNPHHKPEERREGLGSGVIISNDGLILTNHHVIKNADTIEISLSDGRKGNATLIGSDPESDIALLKTSLDNLHSITFADESKTQVGDVVLALGNPFGVGQTVTMGIISATSRKGLGINTFENFLQTDAAINPGNSGGALVDSNGHLLGINTAIFSKSGGNMGIGFAIPVSLTKKIWPQLLKKGQVERGYIGIEGISLNEQLNDELKTELSIDKKQKGVLVRGVAKNGSADLGGIQAGDIIVKINDQSIDDMSMLLNIIANMKPDNKAQVLVLREGREMKLQVKIMPRPIPKEKENQ